MIYANKFDQMWKFIIHYKNYFVDFTKILSIEEKFYFRNVSVTPDFYFFIFTFLYINSRRNWFREYFLLPVFDGCTRFGMFGTLFDYFWKIFSGICTSVSLHVRDKNV